MKTVTTDIEGEIVMKTVLPGILSRVFAAVVLMVVGVFNAAGAAEIEWKMHAVWGMAREEAKYLQRWTERVNARTGDRFNVKLFPGGALGIKDVDMLRVLPPGNAIQIAGFYPGYASRDIGALAYLLPPGVVDSPDKIAALLPELEKIYQNSYDDWGIKLIDMTVPLHSTIEIMCREPVNSLEALRTRKVRVWERHSVETFKKLGISAQIIPQGDLYVAMKTGVFDCALYIASLAKTISLQEVAPYAAYITPHAIQPNSIIASKKAWDALPPDIEKVLLEEVRKLNAEQAQAFKAGTWQNQAMKEFEEAGGKVIEPFSEADREAFTKAALEAWKELSQEAGEKAMRNYEQVRAALEK